MKQVQELPSHIIDAYEIVRDSGTCTELGPLTRHSQSLFYFDCTFAIPTPNKERLPGKITLRAQFSDQWQFHEVSFFPLEGESALRGFPHQDAETGKLCLKPSSDAPWNENRISCYVSWAKEWLIDAANGNLLSPGDPYELPDFSRKLLSGRQLTDLSVLVDESADTYRFWKERVGETGYVSIHRSKHPRGLFVTHFRNESRQRIRFTSFTSNLAKSNDCFETRWILLPEVAYERHRPPQFFHELRDLFHQSQISLDKLLKEAWRAGGKDAQYSLLLIGHPIPETVGEEPSEVHWQPVFFENEYAIKRALSRAKGKRDRGRLWHHAKTSTPFADQCPVRWGKIENLSRQRMFARGATHPSVQECKIAIIGCGALGSFAAEALFRSGVTRLVLIDNQFVEFGNLCRHTLDGDDVNQSKSLALRDRLLTINPAASVVAHCSRVPICRADSSQAQRDLESVDVIIDCSTDHGAFLWLSNFARTEGMRCASMFTNIHSTLLTLIMSGKQTSAEKTSLLLNRDIANGGTPVHANDYFSDNTNELIVPGAGCWHPTFPAINRHLWQLTASALDYVVEWIERPYLCDGYGIAIKRNDGVSTGAVVETIWNRKYR